MEGLVQIKGIFAFSLVVALLPSSEAQASQAGSTQSTIVGEPTEQELVDSLLPVPLRPPRPFPDNVEWMVTFRVLPVGTPEFWAQVKVLYGGDVAIEAISVEGAPLSVQ